MRQPPSTLQGDRVHLREAGAGDVDVLLMILGEPEVARWWGPAGAAQLAADLTQPEPSVFVVEVDATVAGLIEVYEEKDPDYRSASIDISLGSRWQGRGLGTEAVRTMARHLFEGRGHHRITIDPAAENARAIACYRKAGFKPVGIMRQHERGPDGTWHDGLLMDLLRDELVEPSPA